MHRSTWTGGSRGSGPPRSDAGSRRRHTVASELATIVPRPEVPQSSTASVPVDPIALALAGLSPATAEGYRADLAHFGRWAGRDAGGAVRSLLGLEQGPA